MKLQEVNSVPGVKPKGLALMQLKMTVTELVGRISENSEVVQEEMGDKEYYKLILKLQKILKIEGEVSWSFLADGYETINSLKKD